jgi:hypothetical protein
MVPSHKVYFIQPVSVTLSCWFFLQAYRVDVGVIVGVGVGLFGVVVGVIVIVGVGVGLFGVEVGVGVGRVVPEVQGVKVSKQ